MSVTAHNRADLLIELLTEELPPKALATLGRAFADSVYESLCKQGLCDDRSAPTAYAAPRRLAVTISSVAHQAADRQLREKLLPVSIALDAKGNPTAPLVKKLAALGLELGKNIALSSLEKVHDGKQDNFFCQFTAKGASLAEAAQQALDHAIARLPIPKVMNYQRNDGTTVRFVRPVHGLVALHGTAVLDVTALGLRAGRSTRGHRFHAPGPLELPAADQYASLLATKGKVIASFNERQDAIEKALKTQARGEHVIMPPALLAEVTGLVEWPVVLEGRFDEAFLSVPQECLILTMQQNQKYFALTDAGGKLINRFLLVSNIESGDPQVVISGNERVLRARLADAKFFFDQDRKKPLSARCEGLDRVIYHNKIGSQGERIRRLEVLAAEIASLIGADPKKTRRSAQLAKADLLTDMVGEFPELQGVIGAIYARHDHEPAEVARAIEEHYRPRFSGDVLPQDPVAIALALADKLETIVGIWGIGLAPTGDKDPFALRRHALGVVRILMEKNLALPMGELIAMTAKAFSGVAAVNPDGQAIAEFLRDRLRTLLKEEGYTAEEIEAVLAPCSERPDQLPARLSALRAFMLKPEAQSLCSANKRISNILKKAQIPRADIRTERLIEPSEKTLASLLERIGPAAQAAVSKSRYGEALEGLAQLKAPVDEFFDKVMVMAEDASLRENRLALMRDLHQAMNQVADLSRLAI